MAVHQMFAPELSEEELKDLLSGVSAEEKTKEALIDGEIINEEDENVEETENRNDIGNLSDWLVEDRIFSILVIVVF